VSRLCLQLGNPLIVHVYRGKVRRASRNVTTVEVRLDFDSLPHLWYHSRCQLNSTDEIFLIKRGGGTGPVKPRQPGCAK